VRVDVVRTVLPSSSVTKIAVFSQYFECDTASTSWPTA
jgi:hypothetical protein